MAIPETIIIEIDDAELETVMVTLRPVTTEIEKLRYRFGTADLPTINRELRLIAGQVPMLREAIMYWYRLRRLQRGVVVGGISFYLTILATAIVLLREVQQHQKRIERREKDYEMLIRRYRGLNHEEYLAEMERWKLYSRSIPP